LISGRPATGWGGLRALLVDASVTGVAPRLDAAIWLAGELHELSSSGDGPAPFDLASLTKPLASGLVALSLSAEGKVELDAATADGPTVRQLLDHSAGYPEWLPFFRACFPDVVARRIFVDPRAEPARLGAAFARSREITSRSVAAARPEHVAGTQTAYSDVGFLKLQQHLEAAGGDTLAALFASRVARPLGVHLQFVDLAQASLAALQAVPTGTRRPRPPAAGQELALADLPAATVGLLPGQVDDDNAYALGGIAGHAGLFGTAGAVALAGARFLEECEGAGRLGPADLARTFCGPSGPGGRGLGWDRPSGRSSLGTILGRGRQGAIGHLGFTGTSLWIDRDRRLSVALCSNRVLLGRDNEQIRDFRRSFHDAVARTLGLD
jgi:CubicO group peptidase (beta-lactamase class C family)